MKAVILERKGEYAAVLTENGTFIKVRHTGEVGDEIDTDERPVRISFTRNRTFRTIAAASLTIAVLGGAAYNYTALTVSAYVSLDAEDHSIELSVNRLGRIISVRAITDSDTAFARTMNERFRGKRVEDAVIGTWSLLREEGYLTSKDEPMIAGITSDSEKQADKLNEAIEKAVSDSSDIPVITVTVSGQERLDAQSQELSGGQYVYERSEPSAAIPEEVPAVTEVYAIVSDIIEETAPQVTDNTEAAEPDTAETAPEKEDNATEEVTSVTVDTEHEEISQSTESADETVRAEADVPQIVTGSPKNETVPETVERKPEVRNDIPEEQDSPEKPPEEMKDRSPVQDEAPKPIQPENGEYGNAAVPQPYHPEDNSQGRQENERTPQTDGMETAPDETKPAEQQAPDEHFPDNGSEMPPQQGDNNAPREQMPDPQNVQAGPSQPPAAGEMRGDPVQQNGGQGAPAMMPPQ